MQFPTLTAFALMCASSVAAEGPFRDHMIDCSALYSVAAGWGSTADRAARLHAVAGSYAQVAEAQARADGVTAPRRFVAARYSESRNALTERGPLYIGSAHFDAGMRACRVLGHEAGVSARLWLLSD